MNADAYKNFFNSLSSRSWKEHRISDVLFALLNSSDEFKTLFIKLLNSKRRNYLSPQTTFMEILREYKYDNKHAGPADLYVRYSDSNPLLIEIKVRDTNYHTSEYNKFGKNYQLCLLDTRIHHSKGEFKNWILITWDELIKYMQNCNSKLVIEISTFFEGALKMEDIQRVNFGGFKFSNLVYFSRMIKAAMKKLNLKPYTASKNYLEDGFGHYFSFDTNNGKPIYMWYGINFTEENRHPEGVMIWIRKDWNKDLFNNIETCLRKRKFKVAS